VDKKMKLLCGVEQSECLRHGSHEMKERERAIGGKFMLFGVKTFQFTELKIKSTLK
jgi:hypothetical protein